MMTFSSTTGTTGTPGDKLEVAFLNDAIQCFKIKRKDPIFFVLDLYTHEENHGEWHQRFVDECQKKTDRTYVIATHDNGESHNFIVHEVKPLESEKPLKLTVTLKPADSKASSVIQSRRV
ncbi:hypothetical protein CJF47_11925 [Aeromonas sobria]|nr:hypothetical protein CJF47_11925 [Aeromonas sobria]